MQHTPCLGVTDGRMLALALTAKRAVRPPPHPPTHPVATKDSWEADIPSSRVFRRKQKSMLEPSPPPSLPLAPPPQKTCQRNCGPIVFLQCGGPPDGGGGGGWVVELFHGGETWGEILVLVPVVYPTLSSCTALLC